MNIKISKLIFGVALSAFLVGGALALNHKEEKASAEDDSVSYAFFDGVYHKDVDAKYPFAWQYEQSVSFSSDPTSSLTWKVSSGRKSGDAEKFYLGADDTDIHTSISDATFAATDETYNAIKAVLNPGEGHYVAVMYTEQFIANIHDFHMKASSEVGHFHIYYLEDAPAAEWTVIKSNAGEEGYSAAGLDLNTDGEWDAGYGSFNYTFPKGKTAKIAITYSSYSNSVTTAKIEHIIINTDDAAVGYMNSLASVEWCSDPENPTLKKRTLQFFADYLSTKENEALEDVTITGDLAEKTSFDNYYLLLEYILNKCGVSFTNSLNKLDSFEATVGTNGYSAVIIVIASSALLTSVGALFIIKKRKSK